jgi:hypothetical protein
MQKPSTSESNGFIKASGEGGTAIELFIAGVRGFDATTRSAVSSYEAFSSSTTH